MPWRRAGFGSHLPGYFQEGSAPGVVIENQTGIGIGYVGPGNAVHEGGRQLHGLPKPVYLFVVAFLACALRQRLLNAPFQGGFCREKLIDRIIEPGVVVRILVHEGDLELLKKPLSEFPDQNG